MKRKLTVFVSLVLLLVLVCTTAFARTSKEIELLEGLATGFEAVLDASTDGIPVKCVYLEDMDAIALGVAMEGISSAALRKKYDTDSDFKDQTIDALMKLYQSIYSVLESSGYEEVSVFVMLFGDDGEAAVSVVDGADVTPYMD